MATDQDIRNMLIARIPGLKARQRALLCKKFQSAEDLRALSPAALIREVTPQPRLDANAPNWDMDALQRRVERDMLSMEIHGIKTVSLSEEAYPPLLREIYDPPAILFYRGALFSTSCAAAFVGTRKPDGTALAAVWQIARDLGQAGVPVVSGLALGIDAAAHRGNIDGGGKTVAVLGSAVDEVYPVSNRPLARQILEQGGALVSEYPPGTPPCKWHFPERNRIISGLCPAVLVACAPQKSGALITADFALEQGRDLWVMLNEGKPLGEGCRKLFEDGARGISCAADILREWNIESPAAGNGEDSLAASLASELGLTLPAGGAGQKDPVD